MSGSSWVYLTNNTIQKRLTVRTSEFYCADKGKLWWKYPNPDPFAIISGYNVSCELEVWFTPSGGSQKLYKKETLSVGFAS